MIEDAIVKKYDNYSIIDIKENKFKTNSLVFSYKYKTNKKKTGKFKMVMQGENGKDTYELS